MTVHRGPLAVFRHKMFRTLWLASLISNFGGLVQLVGAAWMMTILSGSPSMVALVQASVSLPVVLTSLMAGVLADNFDRRLVMLSAQIFMLAVSVVLTGLAYWNVVSPWLLLTFTFLIGCGTALHYPSWQASLGDLVPREELPTAVSVNAMGMNITRSVGPAFGGAIVAMAGAAAAFAFNAFTYIAIITGLFFFNQSPPPRRLPRERLGGALTAGLRYFLMSPTLVSAVFRAALFGFGAIAMQALSPLVARDQLHGDSTVYGILLGAFGAGAVSGVFVSGGLRARLGAENICRCGFVVFSVACLVVACLVVAFSANVMVIAAALFVSGACWINVLSLINANIQMSTPRWVLGRMVALYMTGLFGRMTIGSWAWGAVAGTLGLPAAFVGSGIALGIGAACGLRWPLVQYGAFDLDPLDQFIEPALRLDLNRRSGPVTIIVEYDIAQADVPKFLRLMAERRRIRIRNSARNWALLRDLERPDTWMESYHFPTWIEYVRHNERRTRSDHEVTQRLFARPRFFAAARASYDRATDRATRR